MSTPPSTNGHPPYSPSTACELDHVLPLPEGTAFDELQELVVAGTEFVPPKKHTNGGPSPSDVPISAHILEQEARLNRALGSKITPTRRLWTSEVPALKEPVKIKVLKKNTGTLPSRPSGRENVAPTSTKRPWGV
ncbi:hypothetical protein B0H14DRAFT_3897414 [Mycena olivaceomarginata]|nr:hypothetical protein B0H14DRAFT_3897414 [Mycena olivaceomarginata]